LVAIAIDDIGKDPDLAEEIEQQAGDSTYEDHSELVFKAAQEGLIAALEMVPTSSHNDVLTCLQIGSRLNISQVVQGECSPASLDVLSGSENQGQGFTLRTMVTLLDVAGAAGPADSRSCIMMNEPVFQAYMIAIEALDYHNYVHATITFWKHERKIWNFRALFSIVNGCKVGARSAALHRTCHQEGSGRAI